MSETISRILVPIDFSPHSVEALHYAARLALGVGATIELLHVVDDPVLSGAWNPDVFVSDIGALMSDLIDDAHRRLEALATQLPQELTRTVVVLRGQPARAIIEHAWTAAFDLIVMGTHGRTGLSHALRGSVAERVLRTAPCPVLTCKDGFAPHGKHQTSLISVLA